MLSCPLFAELIAIEKRDKGNLYELIICIRFSKDIQGKGSITVYREDRTVGKAVEVGLALQDDAVWLTANPGGLDNQGMLFTATVSYMHPYRPDLFVDLDKPIFSLNAIDLPAVPGFGMKRQTQLNLI